MGHEELHTVTNVKIGLGMITCALALLAQFYPVKFPANYNVLVLCVASYCGFNTLLQLYITYVEKGIVLFTRPKAVGGGAMSSGLAVRCRMGRFSEDVTITLMRGDAQDVTHAAAAETTVNVCEYMYTDGVMAEDKFRTVVEDLVTEFESGKGGASRKTR
jgi:signal peptidase complex subunit 2